MSNKNIDKKATEVESTESLNETETLQVSNATNPSEITPFEDKPKKSVKKIIINTIIILVVLAATGFAVYKILETKNNASSGVPAGGWGGGKAQSATSVKTIIAETVDMTDFVTTNGEVETQTAIEVFPAIGGKVVQMKVSLGSSVKKGEIIAYIDPSDAGSYYVNSPVTAPISGSIISSPVKTGQKVSTSSVITKIGDIDNLQIVAKVPERYVAELKIGQKAEIILEAYPTINFNAAVVRISPVVDPTTRTKEIILNFDKNDSRINAGMFAKVKLYTTVYKDVISIPQDALVNVADDYFLYVVKDDNTAEKRAVTLGKNIEGKYQILSGINPGDKVVVEGMLTLYEGAAVKDITK